MGNTMRSEYRALTPAEVHAVKAIKADAEQLLFKMEGAFAASQEHVDLGLASSESFTVAMDPRCAALAKTNLEQAVMWATKAITG